MKTIFINYLTFLFLCSCSYIAQNQTAPVPPTPPVSNYPGKKPLNIILMIGDGMGLSQITAGMIANNNFLHLEKCTHVGLIKTASADNIITDSAAGATAFASGEKNNNYGVGVDKNNKPIKTILEIAEEKGVKAGMIATCAITHATPAAFIAHVKHRNMEEEIAAQFLNTPIDIFIGGGRKFFDNRADGKNLVDSLKAKGYKIATDTKELVAGSLRTPSDKWAVFAADMHLPPMQQGRGSFLPDASVAAMNFLKNDKGFFLMIEGSQIDWGGHDNDSEYIVEEMKDFDNAIGKVLDFARADGNTLVIITADHECGGYAVSEGSVKNKVAGKFTTTGHTGTMVPVFAYGPGADQFSGIYENTAIFHKMRRLTGW